MTSVDDVLSRARSILSERAQSTNRANPTPAGLVSFEVTGHEESLAHILVSYRPVSLPGGPVPATGGGDTLVFDRATGEPVRDRTAALIAGWPERVPPGLAAWWLAQKGCRQVRIAPGVPPRDVRAIDAIAILRRSCGMSLAEAKRTIDGMLAEGSATLDLGHWSDAFQIPDGHRVAREAAQGLSDAGVEVRVGGMELSRVLDLAEPSRRTAA